MIQRIQSIYLLMAGACLATMHLLPLATLKISGPDGTVSAATMGIYTIDPYTICADCTNYGLPYVSGITALVLLISIFLYANRRLQMRVVGGGILLLASSVTLLAFYFRQTQHAFPDVKMMIPLFLQLPAFIFSWLAMRSIRKDENMVKAADRIR